MRKGSKAIVRRVSVFEPKHVAILPWRPGLECSFEHLDHRFTRSCILSLLETPDLYAVAKTGWLLHDDAIMVLEERAQRVYGIPDSLLHELMETWRWRVGDSLDHFSVAKTLAKKVFRVTDAQLGKLECSRGRTSLYRLRDVVLACRERFGCLGYLQVYQAMLESRLEERDLEADARQERLQRAMTERGISRDGWPNKVDAATAADLWVRWGKGPLEDVMQGLAQAFARFTTFMQKFGWDVPGRLADNTMRDFVNGDKAMVPRLEQMRDRWLEAEARAHRVKAVAEMLNTRKRHRSQLPRPTILFEVESGARPIEDLAAMLDECEAQDRRVVERSLMVEEVAGPALASLVLKRQKVSEEVRKDGDMTQLLQELANELAPVHGRRERLEQWALEAGVQVPEADSDSATHAFFFGPDDAEESAWRNVQKAALLQAVPALKRAGFSFHHLCELPPVAIAPALAAIRERIELLRQRSDQLASFMASGWTYHKSKHVAQRVVAMLERFVMRDEGQDEALQQAGRLQELLPVRSAWPLNLILSYVTTGNPADKAALEQRAPIVGPGARGGY
jgi:hypothetical protein